MKSTLATLLVALALVASSLGAEPPPDTLTLTDGRSFVAWRITGETAEYVTVRHKGGIAQVAKNLLPEPVRSAHPIDKKQARADRAADAAALRDREERAAQARRDQAARERPTQVVPPAESSSAAKEADTRDLYQRIQTAAKSRASRYFQYEFEPGGTSRIYSVDVSIDADDPEPWPGIPGRYTVKGKGYLAYYGSRSNSGFDRATKEFTAYIDVTKTSTKVVDFRVW